MPFTLVTVTATYKQADNVTPAVGSVTFQPTALMANEDMVAPTSVKAVLDGTGSISVQLPATDDVGTNPTGVTWKTTERIEGADDRIWYLPLPHAQTAVNLRTVAPALPAAAAYGYALDNQVVHLANPETVTGVKTFTANPVLPVPGATPSTSAVADAAAKGTSQQAAMSDHVHGREAFGTPGASAVGDSAAQGAAATDARSDHRHGREGFGSVSAQTAFGAASADGAAATVSHSDHTHGTPSDAALLHTTGNESFSGVKTSAAGKVNSALFDRGGMVYNILNPTVNGGVAAAGDARTVSDGAITSGTKAFTSATLALTQADVGKLITIVGAGAAGVLFIDTIASVQSATACTLTTNASATVSGAVVWVGTDNQTAENNGRLYVAAQGGGILLIPAGKWMCNNAGYIDGSLTTVAGIGEGATVWMPVGAFAGFWFNGPSDCLACDLTVDGSNQVSGSGVYGIRHDNGSRLRTVNVEVKKTWDRGLSYTACTDIGISLAFVHNCGDNNPAAGAGADGIALVACLRASIVGPIVEDCTRQYVHGIIISASSGAGSTDVTIVGYVCKNMGSGSLAGAGALAVISHQTNAAIRTKRISVTGLTALQTSIDSVIWIQADEFSGAAWVIEGGGNGVEIQDCVMGALAAVLTYNTATEGFIIHNGTLDLVGINRWALSGCVADTVTTLSRAGFHIKEDSAVMNTVVRGVNLSGCFARACHGSGYLWETMHGDSIQSGCMALDNNTGAGGHAGVEVYGVTANGQSCANLQIMGGRSGDTRSGGARTQDKGVWLRNQTDQVFVSGVNVRNNLFNPVLVDGTCGAGCEVHQCPGYNPVGSVGAVSFPATGVAFAVSPIDRMFYITNGAAALTLALSGGSGGTVSPVIPANAFAAIRVPATMTPTPTYASGSPTVIVAGE